MKYRRQAGSSGVSREMSAAVSSPSRKSSSFMSSCAARFQSRGVVPAFVRAMEARRTRSTAS